MLKREVDLHRLHLGTEEMVGVTASEADVVPRVGRVMGIGACRKVMDARMEVHGHLIGRGVGGRLELLVGVVLVHAEVVAVLGVARRSIHEEFGRNDVVPTQCTHLVAPFPVEAKLLVVGVHVLIGVVPFHIGVDLVVAAVPTQIQTVFVGDKDDPSQVISDDLYFYIDTVTNTPYALEDLKYPFYPVVGNHDITHSGWALWANLFHTSFYSIYVIVSEFQDTRVVDNFIFLDTANATLGREQVNLIEQNVLTPDEQAEIGLQVRNTFVFSHTSIFHVSTTELTSSFAREETYFLLDQIKKWNVDIAFFGHVHEWDERRNGNTQFLTLQTMCEKSNPGPGDYLVRVHVKKDGTLSWERVHMNYTKP